MCLGFFCSYWFTYFRNILYDEFSDQTLLLTMKQPKVSSKQPWPTKDVMAQIYDLGLWGCGTSPFYSGIGSHHPDLVVPYVESVKSFLASFKEPLSVCDLGCGDFNIGTSLVPFAIKYVAIDIVESLITFNRAHFKMPNLEFQCLDIAKDQLPEGDCAILRQVLQHLSNAEISEVLNELKVFKYIILTEHLPEGDFIPNRDIISGQGIRLKKNSGVILTEAPFNLTPIKTDCLHSINLGLNKGIIKTTLYTLL